MRTKVFLSAASLNIIAYVSGIFCAPLDAETTTARERRGQHTLTETRYVVGFVVSTVCAIEAVSNSICACVLLFIEVGSNVDDVGVSSA